MADKKPIKATYSGTDTNGLAEFVAADTIGVADGGTGLTTVATSSLLTGNGASALSAEANLTFDGTTLNVVGNAGVGIARTQGTLNVRTGSSGGTAVVNGDDLIVENSQNVGLSLLTAAGNVSGVYFGDADDADIGFIRYVHSSDYMQFDVNAAERMRIAADGALSVKAVKSDGGAMDIQNSATSTPRGLSMKMTGGVTGTTSEYFLYLHDNAGERFIVATNGNATNANNSYGAISDIKIKQDIVDARDYWDDFKAVRFRKFRRKDDVLVDADAPAQFGVVAQELETVFPGLVSESNDTEERQVPVLDEDGNPTYTTDLDGNEVEVTEKELIDLGTTTKSAKYSVLSQIGLKVVQELQTRLEAAEAKITALESA